MSKKHTPMTEVESKQVSIILAEIVSMAGVLEQFSGDISCAALDADQACYGGMASQTVAIKLAWIADLAMGKLDKTHVTEFSQGVGSMLGRDYRKTLEAEGVS